MRGKTTHSARKGVQQQGARSSQDDDDDEKVVEAEEEEAAAGFPFVSSKFLFLLRSSGSSVLWWVEMWVGLVGASREGRWHTKQ